MLLSEAKVYWHKQKRGHKCKEDVNLFVHAIFMPNSLLSEYSESLLILSVRDFSVNFSSPLNNLI